MSTNRIQKLLFSEYCDFEDMVLVESPFAQTTREGKGIRQVNLGLTPTKLVLATDVLPSAKEATVTYIPGIDPDIETFELVAVYPVECLNLSIFHRRKRQSLKAHFCNNRILYFELGGFEKRQMFWNLWCERVKFLSPEDPGSSHSETSVATSTSNSTLYLLATRKVVTNTGIPQLWYKFGSRDHISAHSAAKWTDRYLYLGKNLEESPMNYAPLVMPPSISQFVTNKRKRLPKCIFSLPPMNSNSVLTHRVSCVDSQTCAINRFGSGVPEGCTSALFLPVDNVIVQEQFNMEASQSTDEFLLHSTVPSYQRLNFVDLRENAVRLWELAKDTNPSVLKRGRHRRRYGFAPQPHFLHGLGPWSVPPGERYSIQVKRAVSCVRIRRQPVEPELRLPVSKRQLTASISCDDLHCDNRFNANTNTIKTALKRPVIFFWTPDYWYRPRSARDAYQELLSHLNKVRDYCQSKSKQRKKGKRRLFRRGKTKKNEREIFITDTDDPSEDFRLNKKNNRQRIYPFKEIFEDSSDRETTRKPQETSLQYLRRILRMEIALTAWDFDSTTLACQLTLIDRDLFLKIPPLELGVLLWQQTSKNAPNIGALEAFAHRISCLTATEILRDDSEKVRARLIARLINTAEKCHKLSNFQSCKSILCGLQSPAIYRLHITWTYVRKRHATKYQVFENLCRLYRDPRLPAYQRAFFRASQEHPYIPYMGDLISQLLGRVPQENNYLTLDKVSQKHTRLSSTSANTQSVQTQASTASTLRKILSTLRIVSPVENIHDCRSGPEIRWSKNLLIYKCESYYGEERISKLSRAIELLEICQRAATAYVFRQNDLAREYLLKARYREDRENFLNSFSVEREYFADCRYICNF